jgi:hypothetical protein
MPTKLKIARLPLLHILCLIPLLIVAVFAFFNQTSAQTFVDSGQSLPGLYAGSAQWGDYDNDGKPDLLLTGLNTAGIPVTLIYRNNNGTLTTVNHSIPGVYFGGATWGDYDNDGDLDIVIIGLDSTDNSIAEIWKNESGSFTKDTYQQITGLRYAKAIWADYNQDGLLDLLTIGMDVFGEQRTILYKSVLESGLRNVLTVDTFQSLLNICKGSAAFGDYDNDGDLDLVLSGMDASGFPNSAMYKNDPVGYFVYDKDNSERIAKLSNGSLLWVPGESGGLLQTGLNARWETEIYLFENNPPGRLQGNRLSAVQDLAGPVAFADFDGDGDIDIAAAGKDKFTNLFGTIFLNTGSGYIELLNRIPALREGALAVADYNGDGNVDILVSGVNDNQEFKTYLFPNTTGASHVVPNPPSELSRAVVTNNKVILSWGSGSDSQTPSNLLTYNVRIGIQSNPNKILSSVVPVSTGNSGGRLTLEMNTQLPEGEYVWRVQTVNVHFEQSAWSQEKTFRVERFVSSQQNIAGFMYAASAWGDYDNDGDLDLVVAGTDVNGINRTLLYINDNGVLVQDLTVNNNLIKFNYGDFAWGDYDNDGDFDLAYTGFYVRESATSGLYRNDNGVLTELQGAFAAVGYASIDWGDYDNDGDLDLAVMGKTTAGPFVTKIYKNNHGTLVEDAGQSIMGYANGAIKWVDYDNDGDLDLTVTGQSANGDNKIRFYKNNPVGTLTLDAAYSSLPSFVSSDMVWADLDDDGDLDMIITGIYQGTSYKTSVYINNPAGTLTESMTLSTGLAGVAGGSLAVGDYDNDGDPDLVVSGFGYDNGVYMPILKLYKNNTTAFVEEPLTIFQGRGIDFSSVSFVDINGDGDLELTTAGRMKLDETTYSATANVYDNVSERSNPNIKPLTVTGLNAVVSGGRIMLSWNPGVDPPIGDPLRDFITYQIRVGRTTNSGEIVTGAQKPEIGKYSSTTSRVIYGLTSGDYYWSVRAVDNGNAISNWAPAGTFRVDIDPPTVVSSSVTISPDSVGIGKITIFIEVTENFNLNLTASPAITVRLPNGTVAPVTQISYAGKTWVGELTTLESYPSGMVNINISGVTDAVGNVMTPAVGIKQFYLDTARPQVSATNPPSVSGIVQTGVPTNITLTTTFNEPLLPSSVTDDVVKVYKGTALVTPASGVQLSTDHRSLSVLFSQLHSETEYRAVVSSLIKDKVGNTMAGDYSWSFKTARVVLAQTGGSVMSTDSSVIVYLPPNGIAADVEIPIDRATPTVLPAGVTYANTAYHLGPAADLTLAKPAQLRIHYNPAVIGSGINENKLAVYRQKASNPAQWERIGGTVNIVDNTIISAVNALGTFGLFEDVSTVAGTASISNITFTPRVFAPRGSGSLPRETSINFMLGRDMPVTIIIFNTSGRIVKRLLNNQVLNAGQQAVIWNGRDGNGDILPTGLYTVIIKSGNITEMKTVAIANK